MHVRWTSVGRPSDDVRRMSVGRPVGRPSDMRWTSDGRLADVRRTSDGRPTDVRRTSHRRPKDVRRTSVGRTSWQSEYMHLKCHTICLNSSNYPESPNSIKRLVAVLFLALRTSYGRRKIRGGLRPPRPPSWNFLGGLRLPPQVDVRTVKSLKMSPMGRTDLKI